MTIHVNTTCQCCRSSIKGIKGEQSHARKAECLIVTMAKRTRQTANIDDIASITEASKDVSVCGMCLYAE